MIEHLAPLRTDCDRFAAAMQRLPLDAVAVTGNPALADAFAGCLVVD